MSKVLSMSEPDDAEKLKRARAALAEAKYDEILPLLAHALGEEEGAHLVRRIAIKMAKRAAEKVFPDEESVR